ncbi:MAG: YggS family pyridoxal phosphate-dependent enzyme, partial [Chloroflexota bacterium]
MTEPEARVERYRDARARVLDRIAAACARAHRAPEDVTLVAVSKTVAADALSDAIAAGFDLL